MRKESKQSRINAFEQVMGQKNAHAISVDRKAELARYW